MHSTLFPCKEVGNVHWDGKTGQHRVCVSPLGPYVRLGRVVRPLRASKCSCPLICKPVSHSEQGLCAWWVLGCSELPCSTLQCRDGVGGCSIAHGPLHGVIAPCITHPVLHCYCAKPCLSPTAATRVRALCKVVHDPPVLLPGLLHRAPRVQPPLQLPGLSHRAWPPLQLPGLLHRRPRAQPPPHALTGVTAPGTPCTGPHAAPGLIAPSSSPHGPPASGDIAPRRAAHGAHPRRAGSVQLRGLPRTPPRSFLARPPSAAIPGKGITPLRG